MYDSQVINQFDYHLCITKLRDFSGSGAGKSCVFPFKYLDVTAYGCITMGYGQVTISFFYFNIRNI